MNIHNDTKRDYQWFLSNMQIADKDAASEWELSRVLMAGKRENIQEVLDNLEPEDFSELPVRRIFETVKSDNEEGNGYEGEDQFNHLATTHTDIFTGKNVILNKSYIGAFNQYLDLELVPSESKTKMCIESVKRKRILRDTIMGLYRTVDMCAHDEDGIDKAYNHLQEMALSYELRRKDEKVIDKYDFATGMMQTVFAYNDPDRRKQRTINVGWPRFQAATGGFGMEELVIVSAKSGNGKSAFALNIANDVGVKQRIPVLYINSELSNEQMQMRYLSLAAYVDSKKIREGEYRDENEVTKLYDLVEKNIETQANKYYKSELLFERIPDLQLSNIESAIRRDCSKRQTKMVIVDYLGRMDITKAQSVRDLQEWQILKLAATRLKTLAQKYHVCILMVCQLTDQGTLQGSKAIKNECDMWLSINRLKEQSDEYKNKRLADIFPFNTFVTVEKARNVNDSTSMLFRFDGCMMRFNDSEAAILDMIKKNEKYGKYANEIMNEHEVKLLEGMINQRRFSNVESNWH